MIQVMALEPDTHKAINTYIANTTLDGFSLDSYLKTQVGIQDGVGEYLGYSILGWMWWGKRIEKWLSYGGGSEDDWGRFLYHFLDPYNNAGLWGNPKADDWAMYPAGAANFYSWNDARGYYFSALTATDTATRNTYLAVMFNSLGHVMHLVQDMSVPAHTRNERHSFGDGYENWALKNAKALSSYAPNSTDYFFNPNPSMALNVLNLFDTNQYINNSNPYAISPLGLAEYTNSRFVSPGTIFTGYPYPRFDNNLQPWEATVNGEKIPYQRLVVPGLEEIEHFVRGKIYYEELPSDQAFRGLMLDDEAYANYANMLMPRAIGYSSQLLSYFFRGKIEIGLPDEAVYAFTGDQNLKNTSQGQNQGFNQIKLTVKNTSADGEEMDNGEVYLVIMYRVAQSDPFQNQWVEKDDFTYQVLKSNITAIPRNPVTLTFDLPTPIPIWATNLALQVVYQGKLGTEDNAVAVGFKDISEPTPIDTINFLQTCWNGTWKDCENYGNFCMKVKKMYIKISSDQTPSDQRQASRNNYTYAYNKDNTASDILKGDYIRLYILCDDIYNISFFYTWFSELDVNDEYEYTNSTGVYYASNDLTNAVKPGTYCCAMPGAPPDCQNGCDIWPELSMFLGVYRYHVLDITQCIGTQGCNCPDPF
jgi:hypothetical protein